MLKNGEMPEIFIYVCKKMSAESNSGNVEKIEDRKIYARNLTNETHKISCNGDYFKGCPKVISVGKESNFGYTKNNFEIETKDIILWVMECLDLIPSPSCG